MSTVYVNLFKKNITELQKLWQEIYLAKDTLVAETANSMRTV